MNDFNESNSIQRVTNIWEAAALQLIDDPASPTECPLCHQGSVTAAWNLVNMASREATMDLICSSCNATKNLHVRLPQNARGCYPIDRFTPTVKALASELQFFATRLNEQVNVMPAAIFAMNPLWEEAKWCGTSYQWHAASERPPVIALNFENPEAGREIFRQYIEKQGQSDQFEEVRISIIEGSPTGERSGYSMHIYPDPDALAMYATGEGVVLDPNLVHFIGRWQRMYPIPGKTDMMLPRFKQEFAKHKQFMIAPQVRRDGQNFCDPHVGIIKRIIEFRQLSEIVTPDDVDAGALVLPALIPPRS